MPAYYNSVIKGVATVMISYSSWNGVKMHSNRQLITGFLKNRLKFRVSDESNKKSCWIFIKPNEKIALIVESLTITVGVRHLRLAGH